MKKLSNNMKRYALITGASIIVETILKGFNSK